MRAEARAVGGAVRLDRVSLVQEALLVHLLQEVPQSLDVAVVVGDIRVVHVHPIANAFRHVHPFPGVFHDLLAAGGIVLVHAHFRADIGLGDAQFLLHSQFHGKTVGVPAGAAAHLVAGHGLVPADGVLDGTGHHMMDARHAVRRRRTFEENELRRPAANLHRALKSVGSLPPLQHLCASSGQVQPLIFFECHIFLSIFALLIRKYTNFNGTKKT